MTPRFSGFSALALPSSPPKPSSLRSLRRRLLLVALCAFLGGAQAQTDELLQRYVLAMQTLDNSVAALPIDRVESLQTLDRAANALITLSENVGSDALISGIEATFARAREAINENRSQTNLAVQVQVIKGGFQRLMYESALREASQGNIARARERLLRLASDMNFSEATRNALDEAADLASLQRAFEQGSAEQSRNALNQSQEQFANNQAEEAYRSLARAYSLFVPVQDSPRVSPEAGTTFISTINAFAARDSERFSSQAATLGNNLQSLVDGVAVEAVSPASPPAVPPPAETPPEATPVDTAPVDTTAVDTAPVDTTPVDTAPVDTTAVDTAPASDSLEASSVAQAPPAALESSTPSATTATSDSAGVDTEELATLFSMFNINAQEEQNLVEAYAGQGFRNFNDVLNTLYSQGARAVTAVEIGNQQAARGFIGDFASHYQRHLAPLLRSRNRSFHEDTVNLISGLENSPALRLQDTVVLLGHVDAIQDVLSNRPVNPVHAIIVQSTNYWAGWLRLGVMIFLGIMAFVPLYYLNLAFGGNNRNWQWVGVALFLLLLPVMYEGLSFLGSLAAEMLDIPALNVLSTFSIFQNTLSQIVWVVLSAFAIIFASLGLYGICLQFGLVGRQRAEASPETTQAVAENSSASAFENQDTVIDWDEEF